MTAFGDDTRTKIIATVVLALEETERCATISTQIDDLGAKLAMLAAEMQQRADRAASLALAAFGREGGTTITVAAERLRGRAERFAEQAENLMDSGKAASVEAAMSIQAANDYIKRI